MAKVNKKKNVFTNGKLKTYFQIQQKGSEKILIYWEEKKNCSIKTPNILQKLFNY